MNYTSLRHLTTLCRIYAAMKRAIRLGYAQYVVNKKGQPLLRVNYIRNQSNAFSFWYGQKDVTSIVLSVLRSVESV